MSASAQRGPAIDIRRWAARLALPTVGAFVLGLGGLWAVSVTQGETEPAVNPGSAALYLAMATIYALVAFGVRGLRRDRPDIAERAARAAAEAALVACIGAPGLVLVWGLLTFEPY